jgi:hypothetical protein
LCASPCSSRCIARFIGRRGSAAQVAGEPNLADGIERADGEHRVNARILVVAQSPGDDMRQLPVHSLVSVAP